MIGTSPGTTRTSSLPQQAGVYQGVKATGQAIGSHVVNIVGQQSSDLAESCNYSQADQVTVESAEADAVFDIQDLALLIVRCLRVRAPNGAGFLVRQTPVSDIAHIIFDVLRFGVIAKEMGAINLGGTMWLSNSMTVFLVSDTQSRITVASPIVVLKQINVDYFAMAYQGGHINFYSDSSVLNGELISQTSERVYRGGAILTNGIALPGPCLQSDPDQPGNCW
jgi:hypothetical protein